MSFDIYIVRHLASGKVYVGKTRRGVTQRWREHLHDASLGKPYLLHRAIRKHGPEAFTVEHIASALTEGHMNELERIIITEYGSTNPRLGYNIKLGGDGGSGGSISQEGRAKISAIHKDRPKSPETRERMRLAAIRREAERRSKSTPKPPKIYVTKEQIAAKLKRACSLTWSSPKLRSEQSARIKEIWARRRAESGRA